MMAKALRYFPISMAVLMTAVALVFRWFFWCTMGRPLDGAAYGLGDVVELLFASVIASFCVLTLLVCVVGFFRSQPSLRKKLVVMACAALALLPTYVYLHSLIEPRC